MARRRRPKRANTNSAPATSETEETASAPGGADPPRAHGSIPGPEPGRSSATAFPSLSRVVSVIMLVLGTVAVGALFYRVMAGFFVPLFLAALMVVIFRPLHQWLYTRLGQNARLAAIGTTSVILGIVLVPVLVVLVVAATQFTAMVGRLNLDLLSGAIERGRERLGLTLPHAERFRTLEEILVSLDEADDPERTLARIGQAVRLVDFLQANIPAADQAEEEAEIARERLRELADAVGRPADMAPETTTAPQESDDPENALLEATAPDNLAAAPDNLAAAPDNLADPDWPPSGSPDPQGPSETQQPREGPETAAGGSRFDDSSIRAVAAIRTWIHAVLGGPIWSQLRMLANPSDQDVTDLVRLGRESLQPRFVQLTGATGGWLLEFGIGITVMVIAIYYFLIDGPGMIATIMRLSPLDDAYERRLLGEFDRTSRAVVLASVLSALAQGLTAAPAYYVLGFDSVVFLFLITTLLSLVPFLGAAAVWVPCALWLAAVDGRWQAAIGLTIYGTLVISSIDNVIKMFVLHGRSQLHPLLALLSVLGGVTVFGPIGILIGPMIVVFLQTLLEILSQELKNQAETRTPDETGAA